MRDKSSGGNVKNFGIGLLVGAAVGLAAGFLYAPNSGKKTRENLREKGEDIAETARDTLEDVKERARSIIEDVEEVCQRRR